jgi:hypothetical protein
MAGYLDQYGAGEERRNRIIIRSVLAVIAVAVVSTLTWYLLLNHHQEAVVRDFIAALKRGDTRGAYRIWGCGGSNQCRGYEYEKFVKDWGPGPDGPDLNVIGLTDSEQCNDAVLLTLQVNLKRVEQLWVTHDSDNISFAPVLPGYTSAFCPQQIPYEIMAHRTVGKLRKILLK